MESQILDILKELQQGQQRIELRLDKVELKLDETHQIVKALEHSAQINKAEHDKMNNDIAHIKGDVESIRKDINVVEAVTAKNWEDITRLKAVR